MIELDPAAELALEHRELAELATEEAESEAGTSPIGPARRLASSRRST